MSPAQQLTNAPSVDTNTVAASPTPAGQAPDDVVKKLSDLVHDGKYAEAQQLTTGLLLAYPDDQHLIKAKALLDKLLEASNSSQPTNSVAQPAASGTAEQLTGMDKVDYNALIQRARDAQQTTDLAQQKTLLQQFMTDSSQFLQKHPDQMTLWEFRVASALILNDPVSGYEAGQKLLAAGGADSNDPNLQQLISKLKIKGWLDFDKQRIELYKKYSWLLGTWAVTFSWQVMAPGGSEPTYKGQRGEEEFVLTDSTIDGYEKMNGGKSTVPDLRSKTFDDGQIDFQCYLPTANPENESLFVFRGHDDFWHPYGFAVDPSYIRSGISEGKAPGIGIDDSFFPFGWQPTISCDIDKVGGVMTIVIPSQAQTVKSKWPLKYPVTLHLTKEVTFPQN